MEDGKSKSSSTPVSGHRDASSHDELFMEQSLRFSDTLKEMKRLRKQLYSAAEYFEVSYNKEEQKQIVMETSKLYAVKALVNTIDHLGSVAYKLNSLIDEKIGEASSVDLRFSCLKQRLETCRKYVNQGGIYKQSFLIKTPKLHKQYIFPVEDTIDAVDSMKSKALGRISSNDYNLHQLKETIQAVQATNERISSFPREWHSEIQSPGFSPRKQAFTFMRTSVNTKPDKRTLSPQRFPFIHSGSVKRSTSPIYPNANRRYPSEPRRSVSLSRHGGSDRGNDIEQYTTKSKRLFQALLSMRKSRKDGKLYTYMDEF